MRRSGTRSTPASRSIVSSVLQERFGIRSGGQCPRARTAGAGAAQAGPSGLTLTGSAATGEGSFCNVPVRAAHPRGPHPGWLTWEAWLAYDNARDAAIPGSVPGSASESPKGVMPTTSAAGRMGGDPPVSRRSRSRGPGRAALKGGLFTSGFTGATTVSSIGTSCSAPHAAVALQRPAAAHAATLPTPCPPIQGAVPIQRGYGPALSVNVPEEDSVELRRRIAAARWPSKELVADRSQGMQQAALQELARYWATEYDWRACEAKLNALPQFTTTMTGSTSTSSTSSRPTRTPCR